MVTLSRHMAFHGCFTIQAPALRTRQENGGTESRVGTWFAPGIVDSGVCPEKRGKLTRPIAD